MRIAAHILTGSEVRNFINANSIALCCKHSLCIIGHMGHLLCILRYYRALINDFGKVWMNASGFLEASYAHYFFMGSQFFAGAASRAGPDSV